MKGSDKTRVRCIVGGARSSEYEKQVVVKEKKWSGFTKKSTKPRKNETRSKNHKKIHQRKKKKHKTN